MSKLLRLGPFELSARVGRGGMGEVWRGEHSIQRIPVAIKVVTFRAAQAEHFVEAFRNEVEAVAALDHPGIVMVFDSGSVDEAAATASDGALPLGAPWLVMEYASLGSLERFRLVRNWRACREVLLAILDALAHAHARGVVHRDLKPGNLLLCGSGDTRPGLKLTDFGIAHAMRRTPMDADSDYIVGSPHYMAPEQFLAEWREYGPWTDLYALGCVAWELVSGRPPFAADEIRLLQHLHLSESPPPLVPLYPVPPGFDAWVRRLLQKRLDARFERAADAAWALLLLGDAADPAQPPFRALEREGATDVVNEVSANDPTRAIDASESVHLPATLFGAFDDSVTAIAPSGIVDLIERADQEARDADTGHRDAQTQTWSEPENATHAERIDSELSLSGAVVLQSSDLIEVDDPEGKQGRELPPLPATWRRDKIAPAALPLVGAGLGLYGLRTIPLVDRERERDVIWRALRRVLDEHRPRAVVLTGPAGTGKSRLAEWTAERAHEVGGATVLRAVHNPVAGTDDGIGGMIARHLHLADLTGQALLDRCYRLARRFRLLARGQAESIAELVAGAGAATGAPIRPRLPRPVDRWLFVRQLLVALSPGRPVILWLDDVHWSIDSLGFVEHLLSGGAGSGPPILVLLTARDDILAQRPDETARLEAITRCPTADVLDIAALEPHDQRRLVQTLLGLEETLAARVEERTGGNPLFAVQLVGDWVARGQLQITPTGFALRADANEVLPDGIDAVWSAQLDSALAGARGGDARTSIEIAAALGQEVVLAEWGDACRLARVRVPIDLVTRLVAQRLARRTPDGWAFAQGMLREGIERRARDAGRWEAANAACVSMLELRHRPDERGLAGRLGRHLLAAGRRHEALDQLLRGAREQREFGDYRGALATIALVHSAHAHAGETDARSAMARAIEAWIHVNLGQLDDALQIGETAAKQARAHGWTEPLALSLRVIGEASRLRANLGAAVASLSEALAIYLTIGAQEPAADCLANIADVEITRRNYDAALRLYGDAEPIYAALGDRLGMGHCVHGAAEAARFRGELDRAEELYLRALAMFEVEGSGSAALPRLNLGLLLVQRERYDDAAGYLHSARERFEELDRRSLLACTLAALLPCDAARRDWGAWDGHFERATSLLRDTGVVYADVALTAERAAALARAAGEVERALRAESLAELQWTALGGRPVAP